MRSRRPHQRVNDHCVDPDAGERQRFSPPWCRRSPEIAEMLPLLYLHGLSSGGPEVRAPGATKHLADIYNAEDATHATARGEGVRGRLRAKIPKAAAKATGDLDVLLTFYDYPAEHWVHPRTTNPIESTFAMDHTAGRPRVGGSRSCLATRRSSADLPGL